MAETIQISTSCWTILRVLVFFLLCLVCQLNGACGAGDQDPLNRDRFITWKDCNLESGRDMLVITVAQNGSGDSTSLQAAIDMIPENNEHRVKIIINPGIYREKVSIPANKKYVSLIGIEPNETVIVWNSKSSDKDERGQELGTFRTATVTVDSDYFCANGVTFENTVVAIPGSVGMQAVALRISGDRAFFYNVRFLGWQDTLYDHKGVHYYLRCFIQGSVDFICGNGRSLFNNCTINSLAQGTGYIAASQRKSAQENTGFSFVNSTISGSGKIYLGRAWGDYSRTIYIRSNISSIVVPEGWDDWGIPSKRKTVTFGEFGCRGEGAYTEARVDWSKNFTHEEVYQFQDQHYIDGNEWLRL
ncbi:hypothetical protein MKW92_010971 [Papaver armeniacum]|nr:hypothetical protein MKW92_010971 [Papaver armeniacum]